MPSDPIRVVLVDDHDLLAEAIGLAWQAEPDLVVVARARTVAEAVAEVERHCPDVVVLDRRLPDGDGVSAIDRLRAVSGVRVLVLTGEATASLAAQVAEAGGAGLLLKSSHLAELADGVRRVAAGDVVFGSGLMAGVLDRLTGRSTSGPQLTGRERDTLLLLAEGASTEEMGRRLGVARNTVRNHVQRLLDKLGARSKLEAVAIARREGLLN
jgi:DNA-binding NarL/FixJ family response regulator